LSRASALLAYIEIRPDDVCHEVVSNLKLERDCFAQNTRNDERRES
jgi:hypothetical protein